MLYLLKKISASCLCPIFLCPSFLFSHFCFCLSLHWFSVCTPFPSLLIPRSSPPSPYPPSTSTLCVTFPPPLSAEQVRWPPWPPEPFHVVIPLASLGQSPCSYNLLVPGYLHRLQFQASTSSRCPICHLFCHHILLHMLFVTFTSHLTSFPYSNPHEMWHTCRIPRI